MIIVMFSYALFRNILRQEMGWFDVHNSGELTNHLIADLGKKKDHSFLSVIFPCLSLQKWSKMESSRSNDLRETILFSSIEL